MCGTRSDLQICFCVLEASSYKVDWAYLLALSTLRCKGEGLERAWGRERKRSARPCSLPGRWDQALALRGQGDWGPLCLPVGVSRVLGMGQWARGPTLPCPRTGARCPCTPPPRRTGSKPSLASHGPGPERLPAEPLALACPLPTGVPAAVAAAAVAATAAARATAQVPPAPDLGAAASCLACLGAQEHGRQEAPGSCSSGGTTKQRPVTWWPQRGCRGTAPRWGTQTGPYP